jgi:hypothetical protein
MLLALMLLLTEVPQSPDPDPVICVNHEIRPTVFTPKRECMRARHWVRVLGSRERNNLRFANASQARRSLPHSALHRSERPHEAGRTLSERIDAPTTFVLPPVPGVPIRR